jgi:hypothetical protein
MAKGVRRLERALQTPQRPRDAKDRTTSGALNPNLKNDLRSTGSVDLSGNLPVNGSGGVAVAGYA